MEELREFLDELGLAQLAELFARNDIDLATLRQLDESHLKELGLSLGHRVRLMKALASPERRHVASPHQATAAGERRQVTVMFCDLVGSSEMATQLDAEETREIMRDYQSVCAAVVARFGGHLAQFLGDGVLAYFGYPQAHEDAAERALHAALEIVAAVGRLPPRGARRLQVRLGIATGMVVVGKVMDAAGVSELSAIGETPNLAARLQALAQPDTVVIAEATRALARGSFLYADLGNVPLKGFPQAVRAWRVAGVAGATRFEAAHPGGMTRFVGREHEVALLLSRWEQATAGEGQIVLLCGEPGIGKSRIAEQLRLRLQEEEHTRVRWQCSPFHVTSPLQPVISQLQFAAGIAAEDDNPARLAKLEALLRPTAAAPQDAVPLIASALGVSTEGRYAMPQLTSDAIKRRTLEVLVDQLIGLSRLKPVYWQIEDAHWIDPTTRELVGLCLSRIRDARVFVLITFRPELTPPWAGLPHATALALNRLARRQSVALIEQVAGRSLPAAVLEQILSKTEGIPLFIEELTKAVLESGLLAEREGELHLAGELPPMAIPATLQDSLMARLDRLAPVKEVAQIGAAIGREFSYGLICAIARLPEAELQDALAKLAAAELVYVRGEPPEAAYVFKHALVQDAAYASLLRARRQQLHARIAEALQERSPDIATRQPELLAFHFAAAGLEERAKDCWTRAGRQAMERSQYSEASSHFAHALALVRKAPQSDERRREEARLLLDQVVLTGALKAPGSAEAGQLTEEALKITAPLGDDALYFRAGWADWIYKSLSGDLPAARHRADALVILANKLDDDELRLQAHHARWTTANLRGEVAVCREDIEHGLALYDLERHRGHWAIYGGHDPGVCARATGAGILWQAGFAERGAAVAADAVRVADELGHPFSRCVARWFGGFYCMMVDDAAAAGRHAAQMMEIATEAKLSHSIAFAKIIGGWAIARQGELGKGCGQMETIFRHLVDSKQRGFLTFPGPFIAAAKLEMGRFEEALNLLDEVQQLSLETHQGMFIPELHRLRAEALRRTDPGSGRVEEQYRQAFALSREQGALALQLRAACGYAEWLATVGRAGEGYRLLNELYKQFTEGFETSDLRAARELLARIG